MVSPRFRQVIFSGADHAARIPLIRIFLLLLLLLLLLRARPPSAFCDALHRA